MAGCEGRMLRARVVFLDVEEGPACGTKRVVEVECPHLSRAEFLARTAHPEYANARRWHVYGIVAIPA